MRLFGRPIGDGHPVFVIAEIGLNHGGSFDTACQLIDIAKNAGADAVKFQKRDLNALYRQEAIKNPSDASHGIGVYMPILRQCELSHNDHGRLKIYCERIGINYLCSPWDIPSADFLQSIGVGAFKLPSACFSDVYLIEHLLGFNKPLILSTGMHSVDEIRIIMSLFHGKFKDNGNIALMHCRSSYPTADRDVNLKYIETLKLAFNIPIGFSGHERGVPISVAAVALGANIIERHFTFDRTARGPDHAASLEPHGLEEMIRHIRSVEQAIGSDKGVNQGEIIARETLGKVLTWVRDHKAGEIAQISSFKATSPGYGIPPFKAMETASLGHIWSVQRDVKGGEAVQEEDLITIDKNTHEIVKEEDVEERLQSKTA